MAIYLKQFETVSQYNAYTADTANFIKPNVSFITETNGVEYHPYVAPPPETRVVAKFNVTSTSSPTQIISEYSSSPFSAIEIDGVEQPSVVSAYTFDTLGEHTVKYTLTDPTSIGDSAFEECSGLTSIEIPNSVTSIGQSAFASCTSLTSIVIPNSVTSIGQSAFRFCTSLTSIVIPNSVTSISNYAFEECSGLTSIEIPNSVTNIGDGAFDSCTSLTSIDIPSGVTSIGEYAFSGCRSLTSIVIPNSVTSIGEYAFQSCASLTSITVNNNNTVYDSRNNCNAIIETSTNTLIVGCQNTIIPNSVTSIGYNAFGGCTSLTSIEIPSSVTTISDLAFSNCYSLTSITIPSSVTSIGGNAFQYCTSLTSIVCNATTAPTIQSSTFRGVKTGGVLTVSIGSSGYDVWMGTGNYYLGKYNWTMVEQ